MEAGGRGGWASPLAPSCPTWEGGVGTGHKLTDSRTQSRAHGSRINNFMYTLHTVCTALPPALALGGGVGRGRLHARFPLHVSGVWGEGSGYSCTWRGVEGCGTGVVPPAPGSGEGAPGGRGGMYIRQEGAPRWSGRERGGPGG